MTNQEAVDILRHADTDSEVDPDDYLKAFDMAVNCLEKSTQIANDIRSGRFKGIQITQRGCAKQMLSSYMKGWNDGLSVAAEVIDEAWQPIDEASGSSTKEKKQ